MKLALSTHRFFTYMLGSLSIMRFWFPRTSVLRKSGSSVGVRLTRLLLTCSRDLSSKALPTFPLAVGVLPAVAAPLVFPSSYRAAARLSSGAELEPLVTVSYTDPDRLPRDDALAVSAKDRSLQSRDSLNLFLIKAAALDMLLMVS